jgi:hypothetical protein
MSSSSFGAISVAGILSAAIAGCSMGLGYALLNHPSESNEQMYKRTIGGGVFVFGMYLFSPTFLREFWFASVHDVGRKKP